MAGYDSGSNIGQLHHMTSIRQPITRLARKCCNELQICELTCVHKPIIPVESDCGSHRQIIDMFSVF